MWYSHFQDVHISVDGRRFWLEYYSVWMCLMFLIIWIFVKQIQEVIKFAFSSPTGRDMKMPYPITDAGNLIS